MPLPPPALMPMQSEAFQALDGLRFWPSTYGTPDMQAPFVFGVGFYQPQEAWAPVWEPAIQVMAESGEAIDKMTVNLPDETHEPDQFFVTVHGHTREKFNAMLMETGLFENLGNPRSSGFVRLYAETWTFRRNKDGRALVLIPEYRAELEKKVVDEQDRKRAIEAAHRLGAKNVTLPLRKDGTRGYDGDGRRSGAPRWHDDE